MKIASIVGARPQFIKAAPVSVALRAAGLHEVLIHTGHPYDREMSQQFFDELESQSPTTLVSAPALMAARRARGLPPNRQDALP